MSSLTDSITYKIHSYSSLPFPKQALVFTCLSYKSFENIVGKGEIAQNEQFLLFPQCFLPFWRTFCGMGLSERPLCLLNLFEKVRI